jgi:hypothetical protein
MYKTNCDENYEKCSNEVWSSFHFDCTKW